MALTALKRVKDGKEEFGYSMRIGGGLSNEPHLAVRLNAFIPQDKAYEAIVKVVEIFREQTVLRESRTHARIKYLFMKHGWTAESMLAEIEKRMSFTFDAQEEGPVAPDIYRDHVGVHKQKQEGLSYVGATVLNGRLNPEQLHTLASLAEEHGDGQLRELSDLGCCIAGGGHVDPFDPGFGWCRPAQQFASCRPKGRRSRVVCDLGP